MAEEDDLDAFFDEVSEVEAKAVDEDAKIEAEDQPNAAEAKDGTDEPPAKRVKTNAIVRPRGVVVAASTSVVMAAKEREEKEAELEKEAQEQSPMAQAALVGRWQGPSASTTPTSSVGPAVSGAAATTNATNNSQGKQKGKAVRMIAGQKWVDESLDEWPENDFRIFVGNLSNEVSDAMLFQHFAKYPSLAKAKVVRHNNNPEKSKGYGFVSLLDPLECARALREMDQTWLSSRPIRIKRSDWKDRDFKVVKKREKKAKKQQKRMGVHL